MTPKVKLFSKDYVLPKYETPGSAGIDIKAYIDDGVINILPGQTVAIPTGLYFAIPQGYEMQIRPRSGLSAKTNLIIPNSPGTIDSDYRGELKVLLRNTSLPSPDSPTYGVQFIEHGMRIAQMVLAKVPTIVWDIVDRKEQLGDTSRGDAGFGHTGLL